MFSARHLSFKMIKSKVPFFARQLQKTSRKAPNTLTQRKLQHSGAVMEESLDHGMIAFASAKLGTFFQEAPKLGNMFKEDVTLQSYLKRVMPSEVGNLSKRLHVFVAVSGLNCGVT